VKLFEAKALKTYAIEFFIAIFLCVLAFFLAQKPQVKLLKPPKPRIEAKKTIEIKVHKIKDDTIMDRNLFSINGKYTDLIQNMPENPYTLVAILITKDKKAVLKDYTGKLFTAQEKQTMIDGYKIIRISDNSVILQRGKQKKVLTIFTKK